LLPGFLVTVHLFPVKKIFRKTFNVLIGRRITRMDEKQIAQPDKGWAFVFLVKPHQERDLLRLGFRIHGDPTLGRKSVQVGLLYF
jgi:hypothetical protein